MTQFLEVAERAARAGGEILLEYQERITGREKGPRDLVTEADLASQQRIREILLGAFPEHDFLGEEEDPQAPVSRGGEYRWIVDPLDGTLNYVHRLPAFAVSIALEKQGEMIAGVIYDPVMKECFSAELGKGAWCNERPLKTSGCITPSSALVVASFAPLVQPDSPEIARFVKAVVACQGVRRLGSAALNLAYVAAGRLDAYWATSVKLWDVAAGILLVTEAQGCISHIGGGPLALQKPELLAAASPELQSAMVEVLRL